MGPTHDIAALYNISQSISHAHTYCNRSFYINITLCMMIIANILTIQLCVRLAHNNYINNTGMDKTCLYTSSCEFICDSLTHSGCPRHVGRHLLRTIVLRADGVAQSHSDLRYYLLLFKYCGAIRICISHPSLPLLPSPPLPSPPPSL